MKRVLVTGAAGFLGSHLSARHIQMGDQVIGIDDFTSSSPMSKHLAALVREPNFSFIEASIYEDRFRKHDGVKGCDLIYNFACPASPPRYQEMPIHTMMTCVVGTENVLSVAERDGAIVVHASTSEVYGDPIVSPQPETYRGQVNSYGPRACYDEGKRAAEALCYDFKNQHDVDARLVRIFNTYGPHMDPYDGRVVTNFIRQALANEPLTIYGDGTQTRSFCYVDDLIDGIIKMGQLPSNPGTPINLGNPTEFTMNQLANLVLSMTDRNIDSCVYRSLPTDDPLQRRPDITLAKQVLGWQPRITLEQGLGKTISYFRALSSS